MARARYHRWTEDEDTELRARCARGESIRDMAEAMGKTNAQLHNRISDRRYAIAIDARGGPTIRPVTQYVAPEGPTLAEVFAPEASADETEAVFLARVLASADRSITKAAAQRHARLRIASRDPIAISLSSDWHIAPKGTDIAGLLAYADACAATPGLYALAVGDLLDNPIKHKPTHVGEIMDDLRILDIVVGRFKGKLLGMTSGNHDDFSRALAGVDHLAALARRHRIHYAPDELLWVVEIVDPDDAERVTATYRIHTRHQWRRHSNLNPLHACWTWLAEEGVNWEHTPDVLAIGHNHVAAHGCHQYERKDVWGLRMGAWQRDSSYARAKGFAGYRATAPTVVLPAAQGRVVGFSDPEDAVRFMRGDQAAA